MDLSTIFKEVFSSNTIIGAISSSVLIILLGFFLVKKKIFSDDLAKGLSTVILTVGLPCLSFNSFMQDINPDTLRQGMSILIWGFIFQGLLIGLTQLYYARYQKDKRKALSVLTTLGSTTFFGIPIIGAIYGAQGVLFASVFNISYRVFLYSWGYITFSGLTMNRQNIKTMLLNPIIIATFLGLFIWIFQDFLPQVSVTTAGVTREVAFLRIDQTAFWLYRPMSYLASLSSPLAWLAIGGTLARISLKEAVGSRTSWFYTVTKVVLVPVLCIVLMYIVNFFIPFSFLSVAVAAIMMATPPATVAVAYSIKFEKEALLSSNASLVATLAAVFVIPILILALEVIGRSGIFS
jgi:predicted permease